MGAWGHKSFENDSVLDWFADVETNVGLVGEVLQLVADADSDEDVEVDEASAALGAAELVAAALGKGDDRLTRTVAPWLKANREEVAKVSAARAHAAVARVLENSELADLWGESGGENEWHADVRELLRRLG